VSEVKGEKFIRNYAWGVRAPGVEVEYEEWKKQRPQNKSSAVTLLWVLGWVALLLGIPGAVLALVKGPGSWGVGNLRPWGTPVAQFVFWIGVAHAGTLLAAFFQLMRIPWRGLLSRIAEVITLAALVTAFVYPVLHLGRPWLSGRMLISPFSLHTPNLLAPLSWDLLAVLSYMFLSLWYFLLAWYPERYRSRILSGSGWSRVQETTKVLAWLLVPMVLLVHSIVALDFAMLPVDSWRSTLLPVKFLLSAVVSGLLVVLLINDLYRKIYNASEFLAPGSPFPLDKWLANLFAVVLFIQIYNGVFGMIRGGYPLPGGFWVLLVAASLAQIFRYKFWYNHHIFRTALTIVLLLLMGAERFLFTANPGWNWARLTGSAGIGWVDLSLISGGFGLFLLLLWGILSRIQPFSALELHADKREILPEKLLEPVNLDLDSFNAEHSDSEDSVQAEFEISWVAGFFPSREQARQAAWGLVRSGYRHWRSIGPSPVTDGQSYSLWHSGPVVLLAFSVFLLGIFGSLALVLNFHGNAAEATLLHYVVQALFKIQDQTLLLVPIFTGYQGPDWMYLLMWSVLGALWCTGTLYFWVTVFQWKKYSALNTKHPVFQRLNEETWALVVPARGKEEKELEIFFGSAGAVSLYAYEKSPDLEATVPADQAKPNIKQSKLLRIGLALPILYVLGWLMIPLFTDIWQQNYEAPLERQSAIASIKDSDSSGRSGWIAPNALPQNVLPGLGRWEDRDSVYQDHIEQVFLGHCALCHGPFGESGQPLNELLPAPMPFTGEGTRLLDERELYSRIRDGKGYMPAFGDRLSRETISGLVLYVRFLAGTKETDTTQSGVIDE